MKKNNNTNFLIYFLILFFFNFSFVYSKFNISLIWSEHQDIDIYESVAVSSGGIVFAGSGSNYKPDAQIESFEVGDGKKNFGIRAYNPFVCA